MVQFLQEKYPVLILAASGLVAWLLLRSRATKFDSVGDFDSKVGKQPLVLEFFSNG
jgi:hypothetical protein